MYTRNYTFDVNNKIDMFTLILTTRNHKRYGIIHNCRDIHFTDNVHPNHCLTFQVYKELVHNEGISYCEVWDDIKDFRYVYVREIDEYFEIEATINDSTGTIKSITATYAPCFELSNAKLRNIEINTENDILRDDYVLPTIFYDEIHPESSLLHRIFDKKKNYKIKHVDTTLHKIQRTFSISDSNIYDFCTSTLSEEIGCIFEFDSADRTVSVYDLWNRCENCGERGEFDDVCPKCGSRNISNSYGENTNIFISKENIAEDIRLSPNLEQIKNCLYIAGGDDLITATIANCNPNGSNYIYLFSEDTIADMSDNLSGKLLSYNELNDTLAPEYIKVMSEIYDLIDRELYLESEMMPDITHSETNAQIQVNMLTSSNLGSVAVTDVSKISLATANSAVLGMAKVIIDNGFKVEIISSSLSSQTWTGNFRVTNYSDEDDTATGSHISITITDNYERYVEQKVDKLFDKENSEGLSDLLHITNHNTFVAELKKYALNRLISFNDAFQSCIDILIEMDCANNKTYPKLYSDIYIPYYNKLNAIQEEISVREKEIESVRNDYNKFEKQKEDIQKQLDLETYLGPELYSEFLAHIIEGEYRNDNYISDGLNNSELFDMAQELISVAKNEIRKNIRKNYTLTTNLENLLRIKEFRPLLDKFQCGNWFKCQVDDDIYTMRMTSYEIVFDDSNSNTINVEFSTVSKAFSSSDITKKILEDSQSIARGFSYVSRQSSKGEKADTSFEDLQRYGLNSSLIKIKNANTEDVTIDRNGIMCKSYDDIIGGFSPEQLALIHNTLVFTDDNWKSARCALGKHSYILDGIEYTNYGLNADSVIAGVVIGGDIFSANYSAKNKTGTHIGLSDGILSVGGGKLLFDGTNMELTGKIISQSGQIGCWVIDESSIYRVSPKFGATGGSYFGENGLSLSNKFKVTPDGKLYSIDANITGKIVANDGEIGGIKIGNNGIYSEKFKIEKNGKAYFEDGYFKGTIEVTNGIFSGTIVTNNITATGGTIGGASISGTGMFFNNGSTGWGLWGTTAHAGIVFHAGSNTSNIGGAPFKVYHNGNVSANYINANGGTFNNVDIRDTCTVAGQSITGTIGSWQNSVKWEGAIISGGKIGNGINGSYVGSGINGDNIDNGTVANGRIAKSLSGKSISGSTFSHESGGNPINLYSGNYHAWIGAAGAYWGTGNSPISVIGSSGISTSSSNKNRIVKTKNYGNRLLYCYEMSSPMFGDIGEGKTDETGTCIIFLDDIFTEVVYSDYQYQVFLQPYENGVCYVSERNPTYFVVSGDANIKFAWEIKTIQRDNRGIRLEVMEDYEEPEIDIVVDLENYMGDLLYDVNTERMNF